eukprot:5084000-Alexandrium_andersonii.AAC.1
MLPCPLKGLPQPLRDPSSGFREGGSPPMAMHETLRSAESAGKQSLGPGHCSANGASKRGGE